MPVTLAHPAAVLPLRRLGIPVVGLVIGSMVPDLPIFAGRHGGYALTHSLLGVVTVDVLATLVIAGLWFVGVREALVDLSPDAVRSRLPRRAGLTRKKWLLLPVAGAVGAWTHMVWDSFTHPRRWGPEHIPWLATEHAGLRGTGWAQYSSGIIGLAVVTVWALTYLRRQLIHDVEPRVLPSWSLAAVLGGTAVAGAVSAALEDGWHDMAFYAVVNGVVAFVALLLLACLVWHLRAFTSGGPRPPRAAPTRQRT